MKLNIASKTLMFLDRIKRRISSECIYFDIINSMVNRKNVIYILIDMDYVTNDDNSNVIRKQFFEASQLFIKAGYVVVGFSSAPTNKQFYKNMNSFSKLYFDITDNQKLNIVKAHLTSSFVTGTNKTLVIGGCELFAEALELANDNVLFIDITDDMPVESNSNQCANHFNNYSMVEFIMIYLASKAIMCRKRAIDRYCEDDEQPSIQKIASLITKPATQSVLLINKLHSLVKNEFANFKQLHSMIESKNKIIVYVDLDVVINKNNIKTVGKRFFEASNMFLKTRGEIFGLTSDESDLFEFIDNRHLSGIHRGKRIDSIRKESIIEKCFFKRDNRDSNIIIFGNLELTTSLLEWAEIHENSLLIPLPDTIEHIASNEYSMVDNILFYLSTLKIMQPGYEKLRQF
jgi:hypothetical protein